jgi:hypothetical protein
LDEVLADEALLDAVMQELARRHPSFRPAILYKYTLYS